MQAMNKQEINRELQQKHQIFIDEMLSLSDDEFTICLPEKWTAGQQLEHICLSVKPLVQVLGFPKFAIRMLFGKADRPSQSYGELVAKYKSKLNNGGKAGGRFVPHEIAAAQKTKLAEHLFETIKRLNTKIDRFSEKELDGLILPHPLLGKVTLREMIYFTIFHVEHHHNITKRNLNEAIHTHA